MSIGNIALATLRGDLRERVDEIAPERFDDTTLNRWLNLGQIETFIRIKDWNEVWYLANKTCTIAVADDGKDNIDLSGASYFSTDWSKVYELHYVQATTWDGIVTAAKTIPIVSYQNLLEYKNSSVHGKTDPKCAQLGTSLYFTEDLSSSDVFDITYYRYPVDMTASLNLDVQNVFQDLVIMFAYQQCLRKLMKPTENIDATIANRMNELRSVFTNDVQVDRAQREKSFMPGR